MSTGRVSVISPCYNVDSVLSRLLDSLLCQTYKNLEVILVNDGSTDNTSQVILEYVPRLKAEGYTVTVVDQNNAGVASAINSGLRLFTGEFLTWPDSDDWLAPRSIEERVKLFQAHPEAALVRCDAEMIDADTGRSMGSFTARSGKVYFYEELFTELLHIKTYFAPVCYMVRSASFLSANPSRSIYASRTVCQNLQMLLPITHTCQSLQIDKTLAFYLVRQNSRSRSAKTPQDYFEWESAMWEATRQTLGQMQDVNPAFIRKTARYYANNKLLPTAFRARLKKEASDSLVKSELPFSRSLICRALIYLHCANLSRYLDRCFLRYWSRLLNRLMCEIIRERQPTPVPLRNTGA
jgi:glycosyltransferase involved in cell wall biosynthesis